MIASAELSSPLNRGDIGRFFHHTDHRGITLGIGAQGTERGLGEVVTPLAGAHPLRELHQRLGQPSALRMRLTEEMIGEPQRRLPADAGKAR